MREGLEVLLRGWGASIVAFDSVGATARLGRGERPTARAARRCVIADYRLEHGETGVAAIDSLRQRFGAALPAIVVTGSSMTGHDKEALEHDFHLLIKPVLPNKLRAMIAFKLGEQDRARHRGRTRSSNRGAFIASRCGAEAVSSADAALPQHRDPGAEHEPPTLTHVPHAGRAWRRREVSRRPASPALRSLPLRGRAPHAGRASRPCPRPAPRPVLRRPGSLSRLSVSGGMAAAISDVPR